MKPQIIFLLYINRSGSTFLASQLARIPRISVSVESSALCNLIARGILKIHTESELRTALDTMYLDQGLHNWGVPRDILTKDLSALSFPISLSDVFHAILRRYPHTPADTAVWILKIPGLSHYVSTVRSIFPDAKFLHIVRDPRAVVNSQAKSRSATTGMAMSIDPLASAIKWRKIVRKLHRLHGPDLMEVRYEDVIIDLDATINRVIDFAAQDPSICLGTHSDTGTDSDYYRAIPESQRHLHQNVAKNRPLSSRVDGWRTEMNKIDIYLVQQAVKSDMTRLGYELAEISRQTKNKLRLAGRVLHHRMRAAFLAPIRYARYLRDFRRIRMRLVSKLAELR